MKAELEDWKNGWHGVSLGLKQSELGQLIQLLQDLQNDPEQHFHLSSLYQGESGLGDIEVYVLPECEPDNMRLSSVALPPNSEVKA